MAPGRKTHFGSETRAVDGCIVTYELPDESIIVKRFTTINHFGGGDKIGNRNHSRIKTQIGKSYLDQSIEWCDQHNAKIVSISTPETILRDLDESRTRIESNSKVGISSDRVSRPEPSMLKKRRDLLKEPTQRNAMSEHHRQVRTKRPSRAGKMNQ